MAPPCINGLRDNGNHMVPCDAEPACVNGLRDDGEHMVPCDAPSEQQAADAEVKLQEDLIHFHNIYGTFFTGLPPAARQQGAIFQPATGGGGGLTLKFAGNATVMADFAYDKTPFNNLFPADEAERFHFRLGTGGHDRVFGLGDQEPLRLLVTQNTYLDYSVYGHKEAPDASALAVVDQYGPTIDLGFGDAGAGFGLMPFAQQRTEILGSGSDLPPVRIPYNWTIGANFMINFDRAPVDSSPGVDQSRRLIRIGSATFHALAAADLQGHVTNIDGQRGQKDIMMAGLNTANYAVMAGNGAEFWANQGSEGAALAGSIVTILGGLASQGVGLATQPSQMAGLGAAFTCAGAGGMPRGLGAENPWASRGVLMGCGALQAVVGAVVFASAPDASKGKDNPIQEVQPGQTTNPHSDTSQEGQRSAGLQTLAAGLGSLAYGPFMTVRLSLETSGSEVSGAGLNVGGVF